MKYASQLWLYIALLIITVISYGQMLNMNFYQDDNALMFKFSHIYEPAGNLGIGILGQGPYKYTLAPYLPIYYMFGTNPLPYYLLGLFFIILGSYSVYLLFLEIFGNNAKTWVASLLYACGYIGSDGQIRIFNSVLTSLSIIFICATIGFYHRYYRSRKLKWYILSIVSFFLALNSGFIRTHYSIFIVVAFEIIFFLLHKYTSIKIIVKSLLVTIFRLLPFIFLFYQFIYLGLDSRSGQGKEFLYAIFNGELYNTFSFFTTLGNMLLSNQIFPIIFEFIQRTFHFIIIPRYIIAFFLSLLLCLIVCLYKKKLISFKLSTLIMVIASIALLASRTIFSYNQLTTNTNNAISLFTGIFFVIIMIVFTKVLPDRKYAVLLFVWIASNLAVYSVYLPTSPLNSDDRYITHSFIPLVGLLSLWSINLYEKFTSKMKYLPVLLLSLWGIFNLLSAIKWHNEIITNRSNPTKRFFSELQNYYPSVPKGSLLYFYIPDKPNAHSFYDAGFGVGQMPDQTAIAWRYGIDRYDITLVNSFADLKKEASNKNIPIDDIYTFIADPDKLINTTEKTHFLLKNHTYFKDILNLNSKTKLDISPTKTKFHLEPINIHVNNVFSLTDIKLNLKITGEPMSISGLVFPIQKDDFNQPFSITTTTFALAYKANQDSYFKNVSAISSNSWKEHDPSLMVDQNPQTYWQGDRIKWSSEKSNITLDLKNPVDIAGITYKNGPSSLAPTRFEVLVSIDGKVFHKVSDVTRLYTDQESYSRFQKVIFEKSKARYVRVNFLQTSSNDSPGISEIEVIPEEFRDLDLSETKKFMMSPYNFVFTAQDWFKISNNFKDTGFIKISWRTNGSSKLKSTLESTLPLIYDGLPHNIELTIPAEGQYLEEIIISPFIPGNLKLEQIEYLNML